MALTNFILTVAGVTAIVLLFRSDVKHSAAILRRNVRQIRHWLEEESSSTSKGSEKVKNKELESPVPRKDVNKEVVTLVFLEPKEKTLEFRNFS